jgi:membrane protein implicated in regulation of membrane protease activity
MPLNDHEQRILDEIEKRLAEEDPKLVEQVAGTDLYSHLARRIRLAALAFGLGFVLLLLFVISPWVAAAGFAIMVVSALLIYRYLGQLGRDQLRAMQQDGRLSVNGFLARLAGRFGQASPPPEEPRER